MKKLAIITTHPIQYNAPLFALLTERKNIEVKVFYTWGESVLENKFDPGFGKTIEWDIPLLEGYAFHFEKNISSAPGSNHFKGIDTPELIHNITAWKADAVLVYGWSFKGHLKALKYFHNKIPVFFRGDSILLDASGSLKKIIRNVFLRWIYLAVDQALHVGTQNKNYYLQYGLKEKQLSFAPHAISNERFFRDENALKVKAAEWRQSLGIPATAVVFLFAGKLVSKKDPALLIHAFLQASVNNSVLVIVGNGPLEKELKETYISHKDIHFIGFQNQSAMPLVYALCDVFVLPSKGPGETWGLAVNEAMASKKAVLVSDKCGCAIDLVDNGKNGFVFPAGDADALTEKIILLSKDKIELEAMGAYGQQKIRSWSYENIALAIEKLMNPITTIHV